MSTFKQIQDAVLEDCDYGDPAQIGSTVNSRVRMKRRINKVYRQVLSALGMTRLRSRTSTTISLVAGTPVYTVTASKIDSIYDTTNQIYLRETTKASIRRADPDDSVDGPPEVYAIQKIGATTFEVRFWPTPDATNTLNVDDSAATAALSADGDVPVIPEDFHDILESGARRDEYEKKDDSRHRIASNEYETRMKELKFHMRKSKAGALIPGVNKPCKGSRLGPFYESGT